MLDKRGAIFCSKSAQYFNLKKLDSQIVSHFTSELRGPRTVTSDIKASRAW